MTGDLVRVIESVADASHLTLVVTDAAGVILWREGASAVRRRADHLGFSESAFWTESTVGTSAIGTAPVEAAPVQQRGIRAKLDFSAVPLLEVRGEGAPWIAWLTRRHAEILTELHRAGPDGLSAARLSRLLYGDDQHVVTVRAGSPGCAARSAC